MGGDSVSISDVAVANWTSEVEQLFREYHEWNKQQVMEAVGGDSMRPADIDAEYDIESIIAEDLDYLRNSSTGGHLIVAHSGDRLVGCVYLRRLSPTATEVRRLYVRPHARGRGLGRRLMEALIDIAIDADYRRVLLNTGPHTEAAQSLYADLGFEPTTPYESEIPEPVHEHWHFMELTLGQYPE